MIMYLVISACMVANPSECKDRWIIAEPGLTENQCVMQAMPTVAQWAGDHSEWKVVKWDCVVDQ